MKKPEWMENDLKNKQVQEILIIAAGCREKEFITDGAIQQVYEYIQELEDK